MLPGPLVSTYRQYKEDTDAVASWLASTARACGYSADLFTGSGPSQAPSSSTRLKGKARVQAKNAAGGQSSSRPPAPPAGPKFTIAIKDFVPLAKFVADSSKPIAQVPLNFFQTLNRVITVRSGFGTQLAKHGANVSRESDLRHSHFVGVLEQVREILKPRTSPATQEADNNLAGRFASLELYEPSEQFLNAPDIERPARAPNDNAIYELEPPNTLEEAVFAFGLMMDDLDRIRFSIASIWQRYRRGATDLAAAALATNTACDLARNLTEEIAPMFKNHGGVAIMVQNSYVATCVENGHLLNSMLEKLKAGDFDYDTYDIANHTYMIPVIMLQSFLMVLQPGKPAPLYKEGMYGVYDPSRDLATMSPREKFQQDKIVTLEFLTELMMVNFHLEGFPIQDEFMRGMKELDRTREVSMHLVFAAQMFLDIHHILREKVTAAHGTCFIQMTSMRRNIEQHLEFHKNLKIQHWPEGNDQAMRRVQQKIDHMQTDPVNQAKVKLYQAMREPVPDMPLHRLTRYSPVISGLMLYHFRAQTYEIGIAVANAWGSITYPFHLYEAMRHEGFMTHSGRSPEEGWRDLDYMQGLLGDANFFVGGDSSSDRKGYFNKFCLQMGTTAAAMIKTKEKRLKNFSNLFSRAGPRGIKHGAPVSSAFKDRYVLNTGQVDWKPEHIDEIISRSLERDYAVKYDNEEEGEEKKKESPNTKDTPTSGSTSKETKGKGKGKDNGKNKVKRTYKDLVWELYEALEMECYEMAFPYLSLHRAAWTVLRAVRYAVDPLFKQIYGPAYMERESQLPWLVGWIFMSAHADDNMLPMALASQAIKACMRDGLGKQASEEFLGMGFQVGLEMYVPE